MIEKFVHMPQAVYDEILGILDCVVMGDITAAQACHMIAKILKD